MTDPIASKPVTTALPVAKKTPEQARDAGASQATFAELNQAENQNQAGSANATADQSTVSLDTLKVLGPKTLGVSPDAMAKAVADFKPNEAVTAENFAKLRDRLKGDAKPADNALSANVPIQRFGKQTVEQTKALQERLSTLKDKDGNAYYQGAADGTLGQVVADLHAKGNLNEDTAWSIANFASPEALKALPAEQKQAMHDQFAWLSGTFLHAANGARNRLEEAMR